VSGRLAFPLIARRRLVGSPFGTARSSRRGRGSETAGTRPYLPGDPIATIEWAASARLSAAHGADEFIVRERFAEEAPVVAIVLDRRPSMSIYDATSPWLDKPQAVALAVQAIVESADVARAVVGLFGESTVRSQVLPPARGRVPVVLGQVEKAGFAAPPDALDRAVELLARRRSALPAGSFVFVVSDFLHPLGGGASTRLRSLRCDVVPVVVQDPTWERSFPDAPGVLLPVADVETGASRPTRLGRRDVARLKELHEERYDELVRRFRKTGMDPVTLTDADPTSIHRAFLAWAARRQRALRRTR
jgi:uncharacterized protein (DUF58 family)